VTDAATAVVNCSGCVCCWQEGYVALCSASKECIAKSSFTGVCLMYYNTHTHTFNGPLSGTTQVSRYQKGKTNQDFTEARDSEWQWHQLDHMHVCISLQTDNHASTPLLTFFYRPDALTATQPTASKH